MLVTYIVNIRLHQDEFISYCSFIKPTRLPIQFYTMLSCNWAPETRYYWRVFEQIHTESDWSSVL